MKRSKYGDDFLNWTRRAGRGLEREEAMRRVIRSIPFGKVSPAHVAAAAGCGYHRPVAGAAVRACFHGGAWWALVVRSKPRAKANRSASPSQAGRVQGERVDMSACEYSFRMWEVWG